MKMNLIPKEEFDVVREAVVDPLLQEQLFAAMCRANAFMAVKKAGSGHLGSSFSAMDIVVHLYLRVMNTINVGINDPGRDVYFSSKGHDVPGLYSVLYALGIIPEEKLLALRRYKGLDGHPDIGIPGIEANSGSLGMGISKGRGIAWAKRFLGHKGHVYVLTGDGELQEGQNYEALQSTRQQKISNLTVIVDNNYLQSDRPVNEIVDLLDLETKFKAFGWYTARCNGNDVQALSAALAELAGHTDGPKILIADTIKGKGVSFMEHPQALKDGGGFYKWHSGAPSDDAFEEGYQELIDVINRLREKAGLPAVQQVEVNSSGRKANNVSLQGEPDSVGAEVKKTTKVTDEYVSQTYGDVLVAMGAEEPRLVVLDADLSADCKLRLFETTYPDRFIENGIAEQDMVSMAGGLARHGMLPVVNSFASFLAARANEQIYNNAGEKTKIIYACHYAGLIPAGPGKSHQSVRDISLFGALPNVEILEPCNAAESEMILRYAVKDATENVMIRMVIGPSPRRITLPEDYRLMRGSGVTLLEGSDAVVFAYGPVMLHEALLAAESLANEDVGVKVINMPWLNRVDTDWLAGVIDTCKRVFVVEDHSPVGGLGDNLLNAMAAKGLVDGRRFEKLAVDGVPACGTPPEALRHHGLDGESLAQRIRAGLGAKL